LNASAELLGQRDDDDLRAADVTEPIAVLALRQLANEFGATGPQAGNDVLDCRTASSPTTRSNRLPSTGAWPSSSRPSSTKKAIVAARSSTTMPTLSIRRIV